MTQSISCWRLTAVEGLQIMHRVYFKDTSADVSASCFWQRGSWSWRSDYDTRIFITACEVPTYLVLKAVTDGRTGFYMVKDRPLRLLFCTSSIKTCRPMCRTRMAVLGRRTAGFGGFIKYLGATERCRGLIYAYYITLSECCDKQTCQSNGSPAAERREEPLCFCLPPLARFSGSDF